MRDLEIITIGPIDLEHDPPLAKAQVEITVENLDARDIEHVRLGVKVTCQGNETSWQLREKVLEQTRSALRHALSVCEGASPSDLKKELLAPVTTSLHA
jgi:hypothetical protein